jgi:acetyl-CoA synthetase
VGDGELLHPLAEGFHHHLDRDDVVVLLHGWTGSPAHLRPLAEAMVDEGLGVAAPLLPGHGTNVEDLLVTGWRDWLRAAAEVATAVTEAGSRLHLVGLSMGGLLAILLATAFEPVSLTTINSPVYLRSLQAQLTRVLRGSRRVRMGPERTRSAEYAHEYAHHYEGTPVGSVAEVLDLIRGARRALPRVATPTLVVQSREDETVHPRSARYIYEHVGAPFKRLVWLERSAHVATLDAERGHVALEIARHVRDAQGLASLHRGDAPRYHAVDSDSRGAEVADTQQALMNLLTEDRVFTPSEEFVARANATPSIYERSEADYVGFWREQALERITWHKEPTLTLDDSNPPFFKWFSDGELNLSYNCLDRHLDTQGDKVAYHFVGEPGDTRTITYRDLYEDVTRLANGLKDLGVTRGDRVAIYMGMIPELPVAMLACARIGAIHSVVFGGFSSDALADRIEDAQAKALITQDGSWRRGSVVPLKAAADVAVARCPSIEHVIVVNRCGNEVAMEEGRDLWYADVVEGHSTECEPEVMNAEDPLYILYTSGTTGKPKGIVHTQGGYLTGTTTTHHYVFDIKPDDIYWCAADIGWVTGHSYIVYGPLANGTTGVMYEGAPNFPDFDRLWTIIEEYGVTVFYTAPTAIRAFMKWGNEYPDRHDLSSIRVLGTVGEPINPEAWMWYHEHIGGSSTPIVDTWWQTETGAIMITPLPGAVATKPGSATRPFPGIEADVVDEEGNSVPLGGGGYLVVRKPWPSMLRTIYGDDQRYVDTYWSRFPGAYFPGDGCKRDMDGYFWLLGRVDDIMLVSGHNISTTEVESALVSHTSVAEAAVVGRKDPITGQAIAAFVTLRGGVAGDEDLLQELRNHVATTIGPIAKPASIVFTEDLPKTRSGKIMRRLLKDISENRQLGDVTTLANADIVEEIAQKAQASGD